MNTVPLQLNANPAGMSCVCADALSQGGWNSGQPLGLEGGFATVLEAIVSSLNNTGLIVGENGQPLNIDELAEGLSKLTDPAGSSDGTLAILFEQLAAGLQIPGTIQPVALTGSVLTGGGAVPALIDPESEGNSLSESGLAALCPDVENGDDEDSTAQQLMPPADNDNPAALPFAQTDAAIAMVQLNNPVNVTDQAAQNGGDAGTAALPAAINAANALPETSTKGISTAQTNIDKKVPVGMPGSKDKGQAPLFTPMNNNTAQTPVPSAGKTDAVMPQSSDKAAVLNEPAANGGPPEAFQLQAKVEGKAGEIKQSASMEIASQVSHGKNTVEVLDVPESKEPGVTSSQIVQAQHSEYRKNDPVVKETMHVGRLNEISEPIGKSLGAGNRHIVINLDPPDLGKIKITLTMENGVLKADFRVDSPVVKELFTTAMPQIKSSLESSGIRPGDFLVDLKNGHSDGREKQENDNYGNSQQHNKHQKKSGSQFYDFFA